MGTPNETRGAAAAQHTFMTVATMDLLEAMSRLVSCGLFACSLITEGFEFDASVLA